MTNLFSPYLTSLPSRGTEEDDSKNYRLLVDNGFIFPSQQGMFHFLPLGIRVLDKLKRIIVEELENVGCQVRGKRILRGQGSIQSRLSCSIWNWFRRGAFEASMNRITSDRGLDSRSKSTDQNADGITYRRSWDSFSLQPLTVDLKLLKRVLFPWEEVLIAFCHLYGRVAD